MYRVLNIVKVLSSVAYIGNTASKAYTAYRFRNNTQSGQPQTYRPPSKQGIPVNQDKNKVVLDINVHHCEELQLMDLMDQLMTRFDHMDNEDKSRVINRFIERWAPKYGLTSAMARGYHQLFRMLNGNKF